MRTEQMRMRPERRVQLDDLMARLPGDAAAEVGLLVHFGDDIARTIRVLARELGLPRLVDDDVDALVVDACEVVAEVAKWWRPDGGALPWVYGRDRLRTMLRRWQGPPTAPLPDGDVLGAVEDGVVVAVADDGRPALVVLDGLLRDDAHPVLRCLQVALERVAPRDAELVLLYAQQQDAGDPSPSHTVGALLERSPDAVRQANSRALRRLRRLALTDAEFRPLLALPLLAGAPTRHRAA